MDVEKVQRLRLDEFEAEEREKLSSAAGELAAEAVYPSRRDRR
ncbi:hypothetical protein PBI_ZEECULATE_61 [Mycobacterium phage Zeeculate]|nr:hypothetical protein PBI_ZEECULATE_61 [Mycobacterium phage Zeeculate]